MAKAQNRRSAEPVTWTVLTASVTPALAERLAVEARKRGLTVDNLLAFYAKSGLERDEFMPSE